MDAAERARRRELYARRSAFPVFVAGVLFVVGFVQVVSRSDVVAGRWLMVVSWLGFVADLVWRWLIDDDRRTFPRREWFAFVAVLIPAFKVLFVFYVFVRLARGRRRIQSKVQIYAAYLSVLVITFGAALVLAAERDYPGSNIHTFPEAVWWACVTIATVGYGDYVPVSPLGRTFATVMLVNGVVLISVVTATIASKFVSDPQEGEEKVTLHDVDDRLARLEGAVATLAAHDPAALPSPDAGPPTSDEVRGTFSDVPRVIRAAALPDSELDLAPLDPAQVVAGDPEVRVLGIHDADDVAIGVWQHGVGVSTDVEVDEVFVVLAGRATIVVEGGPTLEVGPGDVGLYPAGTRTTWTVHEPLRKVYIVRP